MGTPAWPRVRLISSYLTTNIIDNREGTFSFGTAMTSETPTQAPGLFRSLVHKIKPKVQTPQEKSGKEVVIHTHVRRGWDHTNRRWQKVIWPELDCNLQPLRGRSTAAWRLDWRSQETENSGAEDPQGSSIGVNAGSSNVEVEQATDPGPSEVAAKIKGKAREVIFE